MFLLGNMESSEFLSLLPTILLVILGSGSIVAIFIENRYRKLQSLEEKLREERQKIYVKVLEPFFLLFKKPTDDKALFELMNSIAYRQATFELALVGSDEVVRAFGDLMQHFYTSGNPNKSDPSDIEHSKQTLRLTGKFLLTIRKDFGNKDTRLRDIDMLRHLITDLEKFEKSLP
jgi:hypothetical protein